MGFAALFSPAHSSGAESKFVDHIVASRVVTLLVAFDRSRRHPVDASRWDIVCNQYHGVLFASFRGTEAVLVLGCTEHFGSNAEA